VNHIQHTCPFLIFSLRFSSFKKKISIALSYNAWKDAGSLQFTVLEILNALLDLESNKCPGPAFALSLCLLFNRSLGSCVFPDRWKLPFVTLIFQSRNRNDVSNYRGIAILSTVGKLFE
jgi:hypothetical protein